MAVDACNVILSSHIRYAGILYYILLIKFFLPCHPGIYNRITNYFSNQWTLIPLNQPIHVLFNPKCGGKMTSFRTQRRSRSARYAVSHVIVTSCSEHQLDSMCSSPFMKIKLIQYIVYSIKYKTFSERMAGLVVDRKKIYSQKPILFTKNF